MARQIFAAEISHENAPPEVRKKLPGDEDSVKVCVDNLRGEFNEVFVLSTSNRFVIYGVGESIDPLLEFFLQDPDIFRYVQFYKNTEGSVGHLFAMVNGLCTRAESGLQILSQIRQAYRTSIECGGIGLVLDTLLRDAVRVYKKVCLETGIDMICASVVDAGFTLLQNRLDDIHMRNFLVIGTDEIARLALENLRRRGVSNVTVTSHDINRAHELAVRYGAEIIQIENAHHYFKQMDVIIGGTYHEKSLFPATVSEPAIANYLDFDPQRKYIILDFAIPRNFDEKLRVNPAVELYDLDTLKELHPSPLDAFGGTEEAWKIINREATKFLEVVRRMELTPILAAYWTRRLHIKDQQSAGMLPPLENATPQDIELIKRYTRKLIRNISRTPSKDLRAMTGDTQANLDVEGVQGLMGFHEVPLDISYN